MEQLTLGILAHVDAGKTTLAEAILYRTGAQRKLGRVEHGDTTLDYNELEKQRGITIFASQAGFSLGEREITLLDTPGHVDFSAETERVLSVLDGAVLVISGTDGVQAHTRTLWRLLELYRVPTFIFVTKMDFARREQADLMAELRRELGEGCLDFSEWNDQLQEALAVCREDLLETYLETGELPEGAVPELVRERRVFPCLFGSGLRVEGIDGLLAAIDRFLPTPERPDIFGAKIFKITHEGGARLTHMKVTGGGLRVRDTLVIGGREQKIAQLRVPAGSKLQQVDFVPAGGVCAVPGLENTAGDMGLGFEAPARDPVLEPVMTYRVVLPQGADPKLVLPKLRQLEEEDPMLRLTWNSHLEEIQVGLMGEVQTEILKSLIADRFGLDVQIDHGRVMYRETIENTVEGVGHYEPLRHYAEVHLIMEPLPRGTGLQFGTACSEDVLDRNWQRLIRIHLGEKTHLGVLTGSPITDMRLTLAAGRAHIKHTEGGDFRQATYRAVRQGLMQAKSVLLEPWYSFRLEVPPEQIGRAISDIRLLGGSFDPPEEAGALTLLRGRAPVAGLNGYAAQLAAYTGGRGRLMLEPDGYDLCKDQDKVVAAMDYQPERDLENSPDSVFCAHGGGFNVPWDQVKEHMHLESCLKKPAGAAPAVNRRNLRLDDKELEAIMEREFGPIRRPQYRMPAVKASEIGESRAETPPPPVQVMVIDGYNLIFAMPEYAELARDSLETARNVLMDRLCGYAAYTGREVVLVFDGWKVPGNPGDKQEHHNIKVVFTREKETGDAWIERFIAQIGKNQQVRVVSSDWLVQLSAVHKGVLRVSAREFGLELADVDARVREVLDGLELKKSRNNPVIK